MLVEKKFERLVLLLEKSEEIAKGDKRENRGRYCLSQTHIKILKLVNFYEDLNLPVGLLSNFWQGL